MQYKLIIFPIFLYLLNIFLVKYKFLIDDPTGSFHKIEKQTNIPLSGGIYILVCLSLLIITDSTLFIDFIFILFLILILILGIFSDIKKNFSPKLRIVFQLLIIISLVFYNQELLIEKTNIDFLDKLTSNNNAKFIFTIFCIITLLNGFNFMDGVNGLVSGYVLSILVVLSFISYKISGIFDYYEILLVFLIFFIFNIFGKSFLGDNGVYIASILLSYIVINFVNIKTTVSPIIAVSLFWYPAIENLFTILRRLFKKKVTYLPDKLHLHSLIYKRLNFTNLINKNSFTGLIINIALIPNFIAAYLFFDSSFYLAVSVLIYVIIYIISYFVLIKK
ncbi:MAG: hypothetical protein CMI79_00700 [Candidatus Pelagibacter sp.]|nr:hypothetical protein [Candidatus Pelagibacter sp.]|tara:strand:- start:19621 stop:20622 length:1002 start_codon:yes stop_codon:yes gene_type:complete